MAPSLFLLVSTHCLLRSSALITNAPVGEIPGNRSMRIAGRNLNPTGCFSDGLGTVGEDGVAPVEDFKRILKEGVGLLHGGAENCKEARKNMTWCPEPRTGPLLQERDQEWYAELVDYLKKELAHTDKSLPIVAAVWDEHLGANSRGAQIMNFACGFERLGMSKRFVFFVANQETYDSFVHNFPNTTSVFHPHMRRFFEAMATRTNLHTLNRVMKLAVAKMVLDTGRDVLITDTDVAWIRDSSKVLHKSDLEFAAMQDTCGHDINSGFVYYRNTPKTKDLLRMSLSTVREEAWGGCIDNDQYVLNCGWKRAAIKGLNYKVLPSNSWALKCTNFVKCHCTESFKVFGNTYGRQMSGIGDGYPYVYHTYGMSGSYINELDMLAALDMVDVEDFKTGKCKTSPKVFAEEKMARSCSAREGAINHAGCAPSCVGAPLRAEAIVADLAHRSFVSPSARSQA